MMDFSLATDDLQSYIKKFNLYTSFLNKESKNMPIAELLSSMDTDKNNTLSSEELCNGLLENCSKKFDFGAAIASIFTNDNALAQEKSYEEQLTSFVKPMLDNFIGETGLDLNNIEDTLSDILGINIDEISKKAEVLGINIDLDETSINDLKDYASDFKDILGDDNTQEILMNANDASTAFKNNDFFSGILSILKTYENFLELNKNNDTAAKYTEEIVATLGDEVNLSAQNMIKNEFLGNIFGDFLDNFVKQGGNFVTGVTGNKISNFIDKLIFWD